MKNKTLTDNILLLSQSEETWPLAYMQMVAQFGTGVSVKLLRGVMANTVGMDVNLVESAILANVKTLKNGFRDIDEGDILLSYERDGPQEDYTYSAVYVVIAGIKVPIKTVQYNLGITCRFVCNKNKSMAIRICYDKYNITKVEYEKPTP